MKKNDEDAFLQSIRGTSPLKEKGRLKKSIPKSKASFIKKHIIKNETTTNPKEIKDFKKTTSIFALEKSKINKKLKKGKILIDKKIDFHGLSVLDAEKLFLDTVVSCYNKKLRCILFITGKGIFKKNRYESEDLKLYYGKIRENFLCWTKKIQLQRYILSVEQANIDFGADGAFFVYLRKQKN